MGNGDNTGHLSKYISPLGAWALAFGCCVGWGAFVMPGTTFLPVAGPAGTMAGLGIGALLMLVLAANYTYMMQSCPRAGGAYAYASESFGYDHGFLTGWFLVLAYIVVFWGNATALPMIARNLLGKVFQFGLLYTLFGYEVYLGEVFLSVAAVLFAAFICLRPRVAVKCQILFAGVLFCGVLFCALTVLFKSGNLSFLKPAFSPDVDPSAGIFSIVSLAPWAFVGFETISHSTGELRFKRGKAFLIMVAALLCAFASYVLLAVISVAHIPEGQSDWSGYLAQIGSMSGIDGLPAFWSVKVVLGEGGVALLGISALAAICTGLIGFITAASRLILSAAHDDLLPERFKRVNSQGVPDFAILGIMIVSLPVPFLGRTAINWLVDVTTICIILAYAYVSASALRTARKNGCRRAFVMGLAGLVISCIFAVVYLVPNLLQIRTMSAESYLLVAIWSILGLLWFRLLFRRGYGKLKSPSTFVWAAFLILIFYTSLTWVLQTAARVEIETSEKIERHFAMEEAGDAEDMEGAGADEDTGSVTDAENAGGDEDAGKADDTGGGEDIGAMMEERENYVQEEMKSANRILRNASLTQIGFIVAAMLIIFNIYEILQKRTRELEIEKTRAEESSRAKSIFLSNMSHDIRTPMNAIIGMTTIARSHIDDKERVDDCLKKISVSGRHLLGIINDVLDMSKIESGKMTLSPEPMSLRQVLSEVCDIVRPQAEEKGQKFDAVFGDILCDVVSCDSVRLEQVLLNFLSNAMKYTPAGGSIRISLRQEPSEKGGEFVRTHFEVEDSGIGMSKEYQEKLFTSFEREDTLRVHKTQGTGLGLAITKYIVDAMGGVIDVNSELGEGSTFHVTLDLERAEQTASQEMESPKPEREKKGIVQAAERPKPERAEGEDAAGQTNELPGEDAAGLRDEMPADDADGTSGLTGKVILLAEDNDLNAEIATMILEESGMIVEWAADGKIATEMFAKSDIGHFNAVLMDLRMPNMNGLEASRAIRAMQREDAAKIPIIALTADAFADDAQRCIDAGMNAHLSKPIDVDQLTTTLLRLM